MRVKTAATKLNLFSTPRHHSGCFVGPINTDTRNIIFSQLYGIVYRFTAEDKKQPLREAVTESNIAGDPRAKLSNMLRMPRTSQRGGAGVVLSSRSFHREILPNASATGTGSFRLHDAHPSIYGRRLQAVASAPRNRVRVSAPVNDLVKERVLQRVEPWIRRELQVILGNRDPSVVVHVVTSLYFTSLEKKDSVSSGQHDVRDNFLEPLRPFLLERTDMFWHELR
ncbi:hypothetical protein ACLB2K_040012 [Fragaria x ananassa]